MENKRNTELVELVNTNIIKNDNVSDEVKDVVSKLLTAYTKATYAEYIDRHEWYRDMVGNMINDTCFEDEKMAEERANDHPTLQQAFYRLVEKFIKKMAKKTYTDARNEVSVKICKKLAETIEQENIHIPVI